MLYIVWMKDGCHSMAWFHVFPTKKRAMALAREIAENQPGDYPNGIVYVKWGEKIDYRIADTTVLVEQLPEYYHGA